MSPPAPNYAKVASLAHWKTFFHPTQGLFRLPHTEGSSITHLEIDLRYINLERDAEPGPQSHSLSVITPRAAAEVYLPNVAVLTLRGAEQCHEEDERMEELASILLAIKPIEVRWLNATSDPAEQLTFSTHLVHPAVIAAGEIWARNDGARKIVMQGGFPCPNLSAPTPYSLTPAATPCPSPGPAKTSFSSSGGSLSSMFALSTIKPTPVDEQKNKERAERRRLAEYRFQPRFEFAFGSWASEIIEWRFDGRYTPACILASIEHLLNAFNKSFPSAHTKVEASLPALITIAPLPLGIVAALRALVDKLDLADDLVACLSDSLFIAPKDESCHARLFEGISDGDQAGDRTRQSRRLKADMLLLSSKNNATVISPLAELLGETPHSPSRFDSMDSTESLLPDETYATTEDGEEAMTPEMAASAVVSSGGRSAGKSSHARDASPASIEI